MRRFVILPILALAIGCGDNSILDPEQALTPDVAAQTNSPIHAGVQYNIHSTFIATSDPGEVRITPGNILHIVGYTNDFVLTGDLEGQASFTGNTRLVLDQGKGTVVGSVLFDVAGPMTGVIECGASGLVEDYPAPSFTVAGKVHSCSGSGDFAGRNFQGTWANVPGTFDYDWALLMW